MNENSVHLMLKITLDKEDDVEMEMPIIDDFDEIFGREMYKLFDNLQMQEVLAGLEKIFIDHVLELGYEESDEEVLDLCCFFEKLKKTIGKYNVKQVKKFIFETEEVCWDEGEFENCNTRYNVDFENKTIFSEYETYNSADDFDEESENVENKLLQAIKKGNVSEVKKFLKTKIDVTTTFGEENDSFIIIAAEQGHEEIMENLIQAGADINVQNKYDKTALNIAARRGHLKIVQNLIKRGAFVNAEDFSNYVSLIEATTEGHVEIVQELIKAGANVNTINDDGDTALCWVLYQGYFKIGNEVIKKGEDVRNINYDATPLFVEVLKRELSTCSVDNLKKRHLKIAIELLNSGANANYRHCNDVTSAMYLLTEELIEQVILNRLQEVKNLIKVGANINGDSDDKYVYGKSVLKIAVEKGHVEIAAELIQAGAKINYQEWLRGDAESVLGLALKTENIEMIKMLVLNGATLKEHEIDDYEIIEQIINKGVKFVSELIKIGVNLSDGEILAKAIIKGNLNMVQELIKVGVNVGSESRPLLVMAIYDVRLEIMEQLSKKNIDLNLKESELKAILLGGIKTCLENIDNEKPENWSKVEYLKIAKELIDAGVNIKNNLAIFFERELIDAAKHGNVRKCNELIEAGADVNLQTDKGVTPLYMASQEGHKEIVEIMIEAGANIEATVEIYKKENIEQTALISAVIEGHTEIVKLLLRKGANVENKDPLASAKYFGRKEIEELLKNAGAKFY